jgi:hypothetical protein
MNPDLDHRTSHHSYVACTCGFTGGTRNDLVIHFDFVRTVREADKKAEDFVKEEFNSKMFIVISTDRAYVVHALNIRDAVEKFNEIHGAFKADKVFQIGDKLGTPVRTVKYPAVTFQLI